MEESQPVNPAQSFIVRLNNAPLQITAEGRIQGNLNQVVQNLLPRRLLNSSVNVPMDRIVGAPRLVNANAPHSHSHSHAGRGPRHPATVQTQARENDTNTEPSAEFVLDMDDGADGPNNNNNTTGGAFDSSAGAAQLRSLWKLVEGCIPFVILILAKLLYDHRLGILIFVGMFGTYFHANSSLRKYISQKDSHSLIDSLGTVAWIVAFLVANISFMYYVFDEQKLYHSLYLTLPSVDRYDVWNLFWTVGVTDFIIKYGTIAVKALVAVLPKQVLPFKKKGKYYMMIESLSQFYRSVVPIPPWLFFILDDQHGGQWFSIVLLIIYTVIKCNHLWNMFTQLRESYRKFQVDVSYGIVPTTDDLQKAENSCAICQDKFTDPVMLNCKHIFCEDCVSIWFNRERTCPMCRAYIADSPLWRDGTTSSNFQIY